MRGMIDVHCHTVPAVDDGAASKKEVRNLLLQEYKSGVRELILTPHYRKGMFETPRDIVERRAEYVAREVDRLRLDMQVYLGCEYHANADMLMELCKEERFRMNGGRYVLVEFSGRHDYQRVRNYIYQLQQEGYYPVVAHVERYPQVIKQLEQVEELIELGAMIQVNAGSLLGENGFRMKNVSRRLLKKRWIHFIASDAHDSKTRYPNLGECAKYVLKKMGKEYAETVFVKNPKKMLDGRR